jgi:pimeloyl-ACP methyl ester carboxylesterase
MFTILFAGCTTLLPVNPSPRDPVPLSEKLLSQVDVSDESPSFVKQKTERQSYYIEHSIEIVPEEDQGLQFIYFQNTLEERNRHLVIIFNILKDKERTVSGLLAGALLDNGYDCIIVCQESFMSSRWLRPVLTDPENLANPDREHARMGYDEYTSYLGKNIGRIINHWLPQQNHLSGKFGFLGVSMGGMHTIGAAALFPQATLSIAIMAGGGAAEVFRDSQEGTVIINREKMIDFYRRLHPDKTREECLTLILHQLNSLEYPILKGARAVSTNRIRMMITTADKCVPTETQWRLYHALGGPETRLYPAGHYTMALFYFSIRSQIIDWFDGAFKTE